jgi:hypothetical protein
LNRNEAFRLLHHMPIFDVANECLIKMDILQN